MMLEELFTKYGTDKGIWGYTPAYVRHLFEKRHSATAILEIGICGYRDIPNNVVGASLFAWRDYFPNATIYGLDNDSRFIFNDQERIRTLCCDAYNEAQLHEAMAQFGTTFDFICDDAVHDPMPQLALLDNLWPYLKRDGVYAIEEVCPYKLPNNDVTHMTRFFPVCRDVEIVHTHKPERLALITR